MPGLKQKFFFCALILIRIFTIIYDVLQHYYDERRSPESWSLLLTSLLAENSGGLEAYQELRHCSKKVMLKDEKLTEYSVVSSHVPTKKTKLHTDM